MRAIKSALILVSLAWLFVATGSLAVSAPRTGGTWYVAPLPAENDGNDCATTTTPCATINAALNKPGFVAGDTIRVAVGTYTGSGDQVVLLDKSATLSGGWDATFTTQTGMSTIDGEETRRGILLINAPQVTIEQVIVQNGSGDPGGGIYSDGILTLANCAIKGNSSPETLGGGGIYNQNTLTITNSTIGNNSTEGEGGGIYNLGSLIISSSVIRNNSANRQGGGIYNQNSLIINNSTISGNNSIGSFGGGIENYVGTATLSSITISGNRGYYTGGLTSSYASVSMKNSILAGNIAAVANTGQDCAGSINSMGYNLIGNTSYCNLVPSSGDLTDVDAGLRPLLDNGGLTYTHALLAGSLAINTGNPSGCSDNSGNLLLTDQRGVSRWGRCDIGAYEWQVPTVPGQMFLPMVSKNFALSGIAGVVTNNGVPIGGVSLQLRFFNGSSWSIIGGATTDTNGYFFFANIPGLGPLQRYYVLYWNSGTAGHLSFWRTRTLTYYSAGGYVEIGRFDIADITLTTPSPGATVALPYTFQWNPRPATPSDSYEFDLFDPTTGSPWWYTSPLGYAGSYMLTGLPSGFSVGTPYCWVPGVYSPDGGFGMSYYCYFVRFSNSGSKPAPLAPVKTNRALDDLPKQQFIHKRP
jgi:hypothetical protein